MIIFSPLIDLLPVLSLLLLHFNSYSFMAALEGGQYQSFPFVLLLLVSEADNRILHSFNLPIFE